MSRNSNKHDLLLKEIKFLDSKEFFKTLFEHAPDPYYISDLEGTFIDGNKAAEKITGYQKEELVGKNFFQLNILPSYEIPKAQQALEKNKKGLSTGPDEFTLNRKDNKKIAVEIFTYPLKIEDRPLVLAIARDITKRKRAEKALSERNKELNCLYRISKIIGDPNISIDQALQSIVELLPSAWQYPEFVCASIQLNGQHFKTKNFQDTKWKQSVLLTVKNQPVGRLEVCYLKAISQSEEDPILKEEHDLINSLAKRISQYLERKKAEDSLEYSEKLLKQTEQISKIGGWEYDVKTKRITWTDEVYRIYGVNKKTYNPGDVQQNISFYVPQEQRKIEQTFQKALQEGKPYDLEVEFNTGTGKQGWVRTIGKPTIKEGKVVKVSGNIMDITERKESEERIKHLNQVLLAIRNINQLIITEKDRDTLIQKTCNILVETRGYQHAWIILLNKDKKVIGSAEAGYGQKFTLLEKQIKNGKWPKCMQKAFDQRGAVITENPGLQCSECLLADKYKDWSTYTICLKQNRTAYGIFLVSIPKIYQNNKQEQSLFKEVTGDLSFALYSMELEEKRKQKEEELRKSESFIRSVMDNLPIGIAVNTVFPVIDFTYMNDKFPQTYGTTREKLSASGSFWDVAYEDPVFHKKIRKKVLDDIASGDPKRMHWENIPVTRKGKETRYISAYDIPLPDRNMVISTVIDVTALNQSQQKLQKTMNATIETISKISETRDPYTAGHQYRVYELSVAIARELHLSREKTEAVRIAALIHDIGKMAIPSEILTKPGKLSKIEFDLIKEHPQTGYNILKDIDFPYPIAQIIRQHHERMNGSGYSQGLKGEDILLEAKIIGVADVVEAMSSHRPYRASLGIEAALDEITKNKGILYDPGIVDVCIKLFQEKEFKFE